MNKYLTIMNGREIISIKESYVLELVDRATPKKPELLYPQVYECPVCNDSLLRSNLYCPSCGQALDWSK